MKIARKITMKHTMQRARDLEISYEVDLEKRSVNMHSDWIDTSLIESFMKTSLLNAVNTELERVGKLPLLTNIAGFAIDLIVAGKARFSLQLIERDFEPKEPTLVMRLLEI